MSKALPTPPGTTVCRRAPEHSLAPAESRGRKTSRQHLLPLAALAASLLAGCGDHGGPAKTNVPPLAKIERQDTPAARQVRAILEVAGSHDNQTWSTNLSAVTNLSENAVQGLSDIVDSLSGNNARQQLVACLMLTKIGPPAAPAAPALQRIYQSSEGPLQVNALIASEAIAPQIPWPWKRILADRVISTNTFDEMMQAYGLVAQFGALKEADVFTSHEMSLGTNFESDASVSTMTKRYGSPDTWRDLDSTNGVRHVCYYGPLCLEVSADRKRVRSNFLAMPDHLWLRLAKHALGSNAPPTFSGIPDVVLPASATASKNQPPK